MTCIVEKAGIVPSDWLAVDVFARTLTSLVVVPGTGATVGAIVGGSGVCVGAGVGDEGRVAVMNSGMEAVGAARVASQPERNNRNAAHGMKSRCVTA